MPRLGMHFTAAEWSLPSAHLDGFFWQSSPAAGNKLREQACLSIGDGLKNNRTLETLLLSNNPLGFLGGQYLMDALASNTTLVRMNLQARLPSTEKNLLLLCVPPHGLRQWVTVLQISSNANFGRPCTRMSWLSCNHVAVLVL